ncbi:hypothetical protein MVA47_09420 [Williamsia sp. DF01-3]|nr:hypothetical protein [Williamsia sp. DF01-3]
MTDQVSLENTVIPANQRPTETTPDARDDEHRDDPDDLADATPGPR